MYSTRPGLVLAFHGCDERLIPDLLHGKTSLKDSKNKYDWLGNGVYFWDNSPSRALEFATFLSKLPNKHNRSNQVTNPAVIGAVLDMGHCLDLLDYKNLELLKDGYDLMSTSYGHLGKIIPQNKPLKDNADLILRELDCAVIETIHQFRKDSRLPPYDSVRGVFWEGKELYPDAGFREKNHIQICIRNPNCIKGYFLPQKFNDKFNKV